MAQVGFTRLALFETLAAQAPHHEAGKLGEDCENRDGSKHFPAPGIIDELRSDTEFQEDAENAVVAAVPFRIKAEAEKRAASAASY